MTELEHRAAEAWAAMVRPRTILAAGEWPMPAGVALDVVQDATSERDDAVTALIGAAADWLARCRVNSGWTETDQGNHGDCGLVCSCIRSEDLFLLFLPGCRLLPQVALLCLRRVGLCLGFFLERILHGLGDGFQHLTVA